MTGHATKKGNTLNSSEAWAIKHAPGYANDKRFTHANIAKAYGVSRSTVSQIRSGKMWACLANMKKPFAADAEAMWLEIVVASDNGHVEYNSD